MERNPLVSVVIPTISKRDKYVNDAVNSVKNQTYTNIEIIVIKDDSVSGSKARNIGVEKAKGEYIAFLDDDDIWYPEKIKKQMEEILKYPCCPLVTCYSKDHRFNRIRIDKPLTVVNQKDVLNNFNYSSTSTYLCRKKYLDLLNGFDEKLLSAQEYDLAIRLSQYNDLRCIPEILVEQYATENQISTNWKKKRLGIKMVYVKHKKKFIGSNFFNRFKIIGIVFFFRLANIVGVKIYKIIDLFRG